MDEVLFTPLKTSAFLVLINDCLRLWALFEWMLKDNGFDDQYIAGNVKIALMGTLSAHI